MKIRTKSGFECDVDERVLKDYRFVKSLARMTKGSLESVDAVANVIELLLGDDEELMRHCERDGFVSAEDVATEVREILGELGRKSDTAKK